MKIKSLLALAALGYADAQTVNYRNQRGSNLTLTYTPEGEGHGSVSGTFATAVADPSCQEVIGVNQKVVGNFAGNAVSFTTSFPQCNTTVVQSGNVDLSGNIDSFWILTLQAMGGSTQQAAFETHELGNDRFSVLKSAHVERDFSHSAPLSHD